jgi:Uma2 family endonuclease
MPAVVLAGHAVIPEWVVDHASFVRWALSDEYPRRGRFAFLGNQVWVDLDMEAEDHSMLCLIIGGALAALAVSRSLGRFYGDRMVLSHEAIGLSTEPDGTFVSSAARRAGRVTVRGGRPEEGRGVIVEGTPDMVLEVISPSSVTKDTVELLDLYWRAGIPEYWLVDPRGNEPQLTLYAHTPTGYQAVRPVRGWRKSTVFGASFRIVQKTDDLGLPAFLLETR